MTATATQTWHPAWCDGVHYWPDDVHPDDVPPPEPAPPTVPTPDDGQHYLLDAIRADATYPDGEPMWAEAGLQQFDGGPVCLTVSIGHGPNAEYSSPEEVRVDARLLLALADRLDQVMGL